MSRTIITKSGIDFFTNIASEKLIGKLCHMVGAKHSSYQLLPDHIELSLAYFMTQEEAQDTADKLRSLLDQDIFDQVKQYFSKDSDKETFKKFLLDTIKNFEDSKGYECLS